VPPSWRWYVSEGRKIAARLVGVMVVAPGTGTPEPGGMTGRELLRAVRRIVGSVELAGMDVVEVSPPYDQSEVTSMLAYRVVMEALSSLAARRG